MSRTTSKWPCQCMFTQQQISVLNGEFTQHVVGSLFFSHCTTIWGDIQSLLSATGGFTLYDFTKERITDNLCLVHTQDHAYMRPKLLLKMIACKRICDSNCLCTDLMGAASQVISLG